VQYVTFYNIKDRLLQAKRRPFGKQVMMK